MTGLRKATVDLPVLLIFAITQFLIAYYVYHRPLPTWFVISGIGLPLITLLIPSALILPRTLRAPDKRLSAATVILISSLAWSLGAGVGEQGGVIASVEFWFTFAILLFALPSYLAFALVERRAMICHRRQS